VVYVDLIHPKERDFVKSSIKEAVADGKNYRLEYRIMHRNGDWQWIEEVGGGVNDAHR